MQKNQSIKQLIIAELDGSISNKDRLMLNKWKTESEQNIQFYQQTRENWQTSLQHMADIADTQGEWKRFVKQTDTKKPKKLLPKVYLTWSKVAAILIVGMLLGITVIQLQPQGEPIYATAIAPKGSVSQLILPDQTKVFLNAGTELNYAVANSDNRIVELTSGEAWFNVTKNPKKPFIVKTPYYNIKVLGTQFNVKAYTEDHAIVTTLEEGSIQVTSSEKLQLKKELIMKPGEQLLFTEKDKKLIIRRVNPQLYSSWKINELTFLNMNMKELIPLLERRYGVNIEVAHPEILDYHYTGTIKNESILEVLQLIEYTLPIRYEVKDQTVIISKK
ncbi:DUF4974 domain-containing protein [Prolixibacteraceae bacterium JC049]|nr:DUF4974 domain-containing protein [Prolixibacteraceae bacterium JC049]